MLKEILYVHLEENNVYIAYNENKALLWLTREGGDLNDFIEFLQILCPEFNVETLKVEEAIALQKQLYSALRDQVRQSILLELVKFREKIALTDHLEIIENLDGEELTPLEDAKKKLGLK